jgi:type IV pilus assembly protein PilA
MKKLFLKLKKGKKNEKGFTLVELIIVIAIIAVLAAILVPSLTATLSDSKNKARMASAKELFTAASTACAKVLTDNGEIDTTAPVTSLTTDIDKTATGVVTIGAYQKSVPTGATFSIVLTADGVSKVTYTENGKSATYEN